MERYVFLTKPTNLIGHSPLFLEFHISHLFHKTYTQWYYNHIATLLDVSIIIFHPYLLTKSIGHYNISYLGLNHLLHSQQDTPVLHQTPTFLPPSSRFATLLPLSLSYHYSTARRPNGWALLRCHITCYSLPSVSLLLKGYTADALIANDSL